MVKRAAFFTGRSEGRDEDADPISATGG